MDLNRNRIRVAIYGCGNFANTRRIPNLVKTGRVEIIALCDSNPEALNATSKRFDVSNTYSDAHEMLEAEEMDVLYSLVPAFARTDVEAAAAATGVHIFSEKPQTTRMHVALKIDRAISESGVLSTVGVRERYNPLFQKVRNFLLDKELIHIDYTQWSEHSHRSAQDGKSWPWELEKSGGPALEWGVHATDYIRFVTGENVERIQAYYHHPASCLLPLSSSFSGQMTSGATVTLTFLTGTRPPGENPPRFVFQYAGGCLAIRRRDSKSWSASVNALPHFEVVDFDPWLEQDRRFIQAVAENRPELILNDYHDGLYSLAPILAGWHSSRNAGQVIEIEEFLRTEALEDDVPHRRPGSTSS
jgi:predicted dehydrogenase